MKLLITAAAGLYCPNAIGRHADYLPIVLHCWNNNFILVETVNLLKFVHLRMKLGIIFETDYSICNDNNLTKYNRKLMKNNSFYFDIIYIFF